MRIQNARDLRLMLATDDELLAARQYLLDTLERVTLALWERRSNKLVADALAAPVWPFVHPYRPPDDTPTCPMPVLRSDQEEPGERQAS